MELTASALSFQNDYPFHNKFWFIFWHCKAYFYAFKFKASQHPDLFLFIFNSHHPLLKRDI